MTREQELDMIIDGLDVNINSFIRKSRKASTAADKIFYESKAQALRKHKRTYSKERSELDK